MRWGIPSELRIGIGQLLWIFGSLPWHIDGTFLILSFNSRILLLIHTVTDLTQILIVQFKINDFREQFLDGEARSAQALSPKFEACGSNWCAHLPEFRNTEPRIATAPNTTRILQLRTHTYNSFGIFRSNSQDSVLKCRVGCRTLNPTSSLKPEYTIEGKNTLEFCFEKPVSDHLCTIAWFWTRQCIHFTHTLSPYWLEISNNFALVGYLRTWKCKPRTPSNSDK